MSYEIGQVIYVIAEERMEIIPLQVTEIQTTKTIAGTGVSYSVTAPWNAADGELEVSSLADFMTLGQIYTSIDEVRQILIMHATKAVDDMISRTSSVSKVFSTKSVTGDDGAQIPVGSETMVLPDGTLAKVRLIPPVSV